MTTAATQPRFLIVKLGAIGDVVAALPAAQALVRAGYEVDWVCGASVAPLLRCFDWLRVISVDDRAVFTGSAVARLRAMSSVWRHVAFHRYAACATLYYDVRYTGFTLPVRADRRLRLSTTIRDRLMIPGRSRRDEYARLLLGLVGRWEDGETFGFLDPLRAANLQSSPLPRTRPSATRVLLCAGGARNLLRDDPLRRWPAERYASLATRLLARGFEVWLIGGADDDWVLPAFDGVPVVNVIGRLKLVESLALMEDSDVLVTHDTGPLHLGGITGISIVSLFGPTDPRVVIPHRAGSIAIWGGEAMSCRPCYDGVTFAPCKNNGCMQSITVSEVEERVIGLLAERSNPTTRDLGSE